MSSREHAPVPELLDRIDALLAEREWLLKYLQGHENSVVVLPGEVWQALKRTERLEKYWRRARLDALAGFTTEKP